MNIYPKGGYSMPARNGSGPEGRGPLTGRGLGYCNTGVRGNLTRGAYYGRGYGLGYGRGYGVGFGRGCGRGFRRFDYYDREILTAEEELQILREEKELLTKRLEELEKLSEN